MRELGVFVNSNFWSSTANFIFIKTGKTPLKKSEILNVLAVFNVYKNINNAFLICETNQSPLKVLTLNILTQKIYVSNDSVDVEVLFKSKVTNMNRYEYKVVAFDQYPRLNAIKGKLFGSDKLFLEIVAEMQNATFMIEKLAFLDQKSIRNMMEGRTDLLLNTRHTGQSNNNREIYKTVNTYDENGWCSLIPFPHRKSYLTIILTPFDVYIWVSLFVLVSVSIVIWKLHRQPRADVNYFVFGIVANFFLQAIPFQRNHSTLTWMFQVYVFILLVLGNIYQSLLISLISSPHFEEKISTVDQMMGIYSSFKVDLIFNILKNESKSLREMDTSVTNYQHFYHLEFEELAANRTVLIFSCDFIEAIWKRSNFENQEKLKSSYYILPQKLYVNYENLLSGRFSPFNEHFNRMSLKIFESGIRKHWKVLLHKLRDEPMPPKSLNDNEFLLKLKDLSGMFLLCGFCLLLASFVFLLEMFWHKKMRKSRIVRRIMRVERQVIIRVESVIEPFDLDAV